MPTPCVRSPRPGLHTAFALVLATFAAGAGARGDSTQPAPVYPLPPGCTWAYSVIPTTTPPVRPVFWTWGTWSQDAVATRAFPPSGWTRNVSFTYRLGQLEQRLPTTFAGAFAIQNVRVEVLGGDRPFVVNHVAPRGSVAGAGTVVESAFRAPGNYLPQYLLRVISTGWQTAQPGATPQWAQVGIDCPLTVRNPPPPAVGP